MSKPSSPKKQRVTQNDIAKLAGVSHVAVSHVLHRSQHSRISIQKQQEIRRIARELGYRPRRLTTHAVAVVVDTDKLYWGIINSQLTYLDRLLRQRGYRMTLVTCDHHHNPSQIAEILNPKTVDGVIFWELAHDEIRRQSPDVPWIYLGEDDNPPADVDQIGMDTHGTTATVVEHLYELGHRYIAMVTGLPGVGYHQRMEKGLITTLNTLNVDREPVIIRNKEKEMPSLVQRVFQQPDYPTAIISSTAVSTQIVLNVLLACGLEVPRQVSIIALVDDAHLSVHQPAISATTANGENLMQLAVERIIERITQPDLPIMHRRIRGEVIVRKSLGKASTPGKMS